MVLGIQIVGALFSLFMLYYTYVYFKKKQFTIKETGFWFILWILFLIVTLVPQILDPILATLKIARTLDLLIILGFMFVIGCVMYSYTLVRVNQKRLDDLVRKIAFDLEKKDKK